MKVNFKTNKKLLAFIGIIFGFFILTNIKYVYAGTGTAGTPCDDNNGSCGGPWDDVDCAAGFSCQHYSTPPRDLPPGRCLRDSGCTVTCGDDGTKYKCDVRGGCDMGEQCLPVFTGVFGCDDPLPCECGDTSPECTAGGNCRVKGDVCADETGFIEGCCVGEGPCADWDGDGISNCGPPNETTTESASAYAGPIVNLESLLSNAYRFAYPIAIAIFGIPTILLSGYKIMTSQGDPAKIKEGKEGLTAAIAGIMFIIAALSILAFILRNFLGQTTI